MIGAVVIGQNEGARLRASLNSVIQEDVPLVYVDSGSTDESAELAHSLGAHVLELDPSKPFSAARARNEGFDRLTQLVAPRYVQFVDGDSLLVPGWIEHGAEVLESEPGAAAAFGRLRELYAGESLFKRLLDLEWSRPASETRAFGGNVMMRTVAFRKAGGFNPALQAGEEPELCLRLRSLGWQILGLDTEMAAHDAGPFGFRDWCRREARAGAASAACLHLYFRRPEGSYLKEVTSSICWGGMAPLAASAAAPVTGGASLLVFLAYPLQIARILLRLRRAGRGTSDAFAEALALMAGKFFHAMGIARYALRRR